MPFCNACGTETPEGARFCQNCGAELGAAVAIQDAPSLGAPPPIAPPVTIAHPPAATPGSPPVVPPYYAYPPPPYAVVPGQPYAPRTNGKAIAGMWLGIASVVCFFLSWVGIVIGILGLIFSLLGLSEVRANVLSPLGPPQSGRSQARAGLILSVVGIIVSSLFLIYLLNNLERYGIQFTR